MDRKQVDRPPEHGVYIDGLYLDGARWDSEHKTLEDSHLGELFPRMPIIHFMPTNIKSGWKPNPKDYLCPVYKTSARAGILSTTGHSTNFVLPVLLPTTTREPDYWVLKGAALLCQLDE
jgi:dynein heavy chain